MDMTYLKQQLARLLDRLIQWLDPLSEDERRLLRRLRKEVDELGRINHELRMKPIECPVHHERLFIEGAFRRKPQGLVASQGWFCALPHQHVPQEPLPLPYKPGAWARAINEGVIEEKPTQMEVPAVPKPQALHPYHLKPASPIKGEVRMGTAYTKEDEEADAFVRDQHVSRKQA